MQQTHPLKTYAKRSRKSLEAIAESAGTSRMTLYRIMAGENTTLDVLKRISAATDGEVSVADLIGEAA